MSQTTQAYCVKCRQTRDMLSPTAVYTATGTPGTRGQCPVCGTALFRMGATPAHASLTKPEVTVRKSTSKSAGGKSGTGKKKSGAKAKGRGRSPSKAASTRTASAKAGAGKSAARSNGRRKGGKLVIVESPAKARTVGHFLGRDYVVRASKGHVRDLLVSQLSVDVDNNFEPKYRVPNEKRDTVKELKEDVQHADEIFLATDPDREGEAIAWHLMEAAEIDPTRVKRVVFHEITDEAVNDAFSHPRTINMDLVNAQQARRILDRLVGYPLTELLWDRVRNRLSAGRVQSIALRLVVDRERSIEAFVPVEYWTIDAQLKKHRANGSRDIPFTARLIKIKGEDADFGTGEEVRPHLDVLERSQYSVADVKRGQRQRKPSPPFTTSTLQQEASRRLGFNARRTMTIAQQLYEGIDLPDEGTVGLITYMRTDSTHISTQAQAEARQYIEGRFGKSFMPARAPEYKTKAKGAQEAHEAIRPTRVFRAPDSVKAILSRDQFRLYELIWQRFVASQMSNAVYDTLRVEISAGLTAADRPYLFRASGSVIKFAGFLALYEETRDEDLAADEDEGRILPDMTPGELLDLLRLLPQQHFTQPPPRYTEATLVRALEEFGIGRPSTYAPTVAVIQDRDYVQKQDKRLIPTDTGKIVNDLLVRYFPEVMDFQFTAQMEDQLDTISEGDLEWRDMLRSFYTSFEQQLGHARSDMPRVQQEEFVGRDCPVCGNPLVVRYGRWGKFIGCSTYPNCTHTEPYLELTGVTCPRCGQEHAGQLVVRRTRRGRTFFGCSRYPECEYSTWKLPGKAGANRPEAEQDEDEAMVEN